MKHQLLTFRADLLLTAPPMMVLPQTKNSSTMFCPMEKDLCLTLLALTFIKSL